MRLKHTAASILAAPIALAALPASGQLRTTLAPRAANGVASGDLVADGFLPDRFPPDRLPPDRVGDLIAQLVDRSAPQVSAPETICNQETVFVRVPLKSQLGSDKGVLSVQIEQPARGRESARQPAARTWVGEPRAVPALGRGQSWQEAEWFVPLSAVGPLNRLRVTAQFGALKRETTWPLAVRCTAAPPTDSWAVRKEVSHAELQKLDRTRGKLDDAACEDVAGRGGAWRGHLASTDPFHSNLYCSYRWETEREAPPDTIPLQKVFGTAAQLDPPLLVPLSGFAAGWEGRIQSQVERVREHLGLHSIRPGASGGLVRLAILDSAAHGFYSPNMDTNPHGRLVGLLAQEVACAGLAEGRQCPVEVVNALALPIKRVAAGTTERDEDNGGFLGTRLDVAAAVRQVVDAWWADVEQAGWFPLVMNLSFGWHGKHECRDAGCGAPIDENLASGAALPGRFGRVLPERSAVSAQLGTEAVYAELLRAHCLGALAFAAAGNAAGGDREGPLLPAAWGTTAGDPVGYCSRFKEQLAKAEREPPEAGSPLVYAVGALGFGGNASPTNRVAAMPELAALGVSVATQHKDPLRKLRVLPTSGTSMSTAIVAGATAALWSLVDGNASGREVVARLHASAHRGPAATTMALASAAPLPGGTGEVDACTPLLAAGLPSGCAPPQDTGPPTPPPSHTPSHAVATGLSLEVTEAPWAFPQPWDIGCSACALIEQGGIYEVDALVGHNMPPPGPWEVHFVDPSFGSYPITNYGTMALASSGPLADLFTGYDVDQLIDVGEEIFVSVVEAPTLRVEMHGASSSSLPLLGEVPLLFE